MIIPAGCNVERARSHRLPSPNDARRSADWCSSSARWCPAPAGGFEQDTRKSRGTKRAPSEGVRTRLRPDNRIRARPSLSRDSPRETIALNRQPNGEKSRFMAQFSVHSLYPVTDIRTVAGVTVRNADCCRAGNLPLRNKLVFILPAALILSQFAPWLLTPTLMLGAPPTCDSNALKSARPVPAPRQPRPEAGVADKESMTVGLIRTPFSSSPLRSW